MALETCMHLSTISTARAGVLCLNHSVSSKEKLNLQTWRGLRMSPSLFFSSSSFAPSSIDGRCRRFSIVCKAQEAVDEVLVVTDSSWNDLVVASENPVLVDFWAPWCGPCRMIAPIIDELAKEYAGKIVCYKVNTDDCPTIAAEYGIRSIPTVLLFKDGEKKESVIGAVPKSTLTATIEKYI